MGKKVWGMFLLPPIVCDLWVSMDVLFSTASILHLCCISFDRCLSLKYPLKYGRNKTRCQVAVKICLVWAISVVIAAPLFILSRHDRSTLLIDGMCFPNDKTFIVASSIGSFYIPLLIMIVTYSMTIHLLNTRAIKHKNGVRAKPFGRHRRAPARAAAAGSTTTSSAAAGERAAEAAAEAWEESSMAMYESGCRMPLDGAPRRMGEERRAAAGARRHRAAAAGAATAELELSPDPPADSHTPATLLPAAAARRANSYCKATAPMGELPESRYDDGCRDDGCRDDDASRWKTKSPTTPSSTMQLTTSASAHSALHHGNNHHGNSHHGNHVGVHKKRSHERRESRQGAPSSAVDSARLVGYVMTMKTRNERKASQTLGIIFTVFMVLWCPFFVSYVMQAVCAPCRRHITDEMMVAFTWFGYCSSMVNPFIYSMFSRNFRTAFTRILACQCRKLRDRKAAALYMSTTYA
ncbi:PREDICTED: alpha-2C adrenergic receptor-like [Priapulus caudatus]|uniref:Alpha-2C adrenergic receptor-like n=1 Tax=Priapulus caudatus TaxID=37621 RepID=A0ABM1F3E3_PRICU|nr:PREDICTED: alpha-2C adrenergic receptor-like [Priapulus caudatus]